MFEIFHLLYNCLWKNPNDVYHFQLISKHNVEVIHDQMYDRLHKKILDVLTYQN